MRNDYAALDAKIANPFMKENKLTMRGILSMNKYSKIIMYMVVCVMVFIGGIWAGAKYSELSDARVTMIEDYEYSDKYDMYLVDEVTRDGFGNILEQNFYFTAEEP